MLAYVTSHTIMLDHSIVDCITLHRLAAPARHLHTTRRRSGAQKVASENTWATERMLIIVSIVVIIIIMFISSNSSSSSSMIISSSNSNISLHVVNMILKYINNYENSIS